MSEYRLDKGRLVGGGAYCEGCGSYLREGTLVFTFTTVTPLSQPFLYCPTCRPDPSELPSAVMSLESALVVEEPGRYQEGSLYEVKEGSHCVVCGHVFMLGEWLLVGVTECSSGGLVYCPECQEALFGH